MTEFHFLRPEWFWGFLAFLILPFLVSRGRSGLWRAVCDRFLLNFQLVAGSASRAFFPVFLLAVSWMGALIALAGPTWERLPQPVLKSGTDTVFLLDISLFMNVNDVKPSRMDRARFKLHDLLQEMQGGQYALELYDNEPFVAVPLTSDVKVIENILPSIAAGMMGGQTPRVDLALQEALKLLEQAKSTRGQVFVLGAYVDDAFLPAAVKAAAALKKSGHTVSVLGIGTVQGAPIQMPDGSFLSTKSGKPLLSGLTETAFEKIAGAGGGVYHTITLGDADIKDLLSSASRAQPDFKKQEGSLQKADAWKDFGVYITLFILPFAALGFRKGWLGIIMFYLFLAPSPASAFSWRDLWVRPDMQEALKIQAGEKPGRTDVFEKNAAWKGAAEYKAGEYQKAVQSLNNPADEEMTYNQGNALAHAGQPEKAIEAYKKVLEKNPAHKDAAFNKKYLEEQLKKQQQNNQDQKNQQDNKNQQNQKDKQNQQDKQDKQEQNQQDKQEQNQQNQNQQGSSEQKQEQPQNSQNQEQEDKQDGSEKQEKQAQADKEKQEQAEQQKQQQAKAEQDKDKDREGDQKIPASAQPDKTDKEKQEQLEWLKSIEDDPSGLLRERIRRRNMQKKRMW